MVYATRTGLPFWVPGCQLGQAFNNLMASASKSGDALLSILISVNDPSFSTTKPIKTLPCIFLRLASSGYLRFFPIYSKNLAIPPGNSGTCSTAVNILLGSYGIFLLVSIGIGDSITISVLEFFGCCVCCCWALTIKAGRINSASNKVFFIFKYNQFSFVIARRLTAAN